LRTYLTYLSRAINCGRYHSVRCCNWPITDPPLKALGGPRTLAQLSGRPLGLQTHAATCIPIWLSEGFEIVRPRTVSRPRAWGRGLQPVGPLRRATRRFHCFLWGGHAEPDRCERRDPARCVVARMGLSFHETLPRPDNFGFLIAREIRGGLHFVWSTNTRLEFGFLRVAWPDA